MLLDSQDAGKDMASRLYVTAYEFSDSQALKMPCYIRGTREQRRTC